MKVNLLVMKFQNIPKTNIFNKVFLTFFGSGLSPFAPGTFGSIATLPFMYILTLLGVNFWGLLTITVILTIAACIITDQVQKKHGLHDPQWIVIDEVVGMLTTWLFIFPSFNIKSALLVLVVFRIFDIFKVFPASYFDKKIKHGSGTILDDVISGLYAGIVILLLQKFTSFF